LGSLQFGQIVVVEKMLDPNGVNPKDRPAVIISRADEIDRDGFLFVVAISTLLPGPLPSDHVKLPWHPKGHPRTGLKSNCAAVCTWIEKIDPSRVLTTIGHAPGKALVEIATQVASFRGNASP
jgi:mRNA-degrading endonuclease toxin of MazEF toxin-antitoxin module